MTNGHEEKANASAALGIDEVCEVVAEAIERRHGRVEVVEPGTEMLLTGMLDSLTLMSIVAELERRVGRELPEDLVVARNFRTPTVLHSALESVLAGDAT